MKRREKLSRKSVFHVESGGQSDVRTLLKKDIGFRRVSGG